MFKPPLCRHLCRITTKTSLESSIVPLNVGVLLSFLMIGRTFTSQQSTTEFFVFQQSFLLNTTFRPGNSGLLRVIPEDRRRPEFPGRNVVFNKNDCWKTKNSVVECKASENVCENLFTAVIRRPPTRPFSRISSRRVGPRPTPVAIFTCHCSYGNSIVLALAAGDKKMTSSALERE